MKSPITRWSVAILVAVLLVAGWVQFRARRALTPQAVAGTGTVAATPASGQSATGVAAAQSDAAAQDEEKRQRVAEGNGVTVFAVLEKDGTFSMYFETHSGDISTYPVAEKAVLTSDKGAVKGRLVWSEDKNSSGHHRYGTLSLTGAKSILSDPATKWVQLELRDLAGVQSRVLRWDNPAALLGESSR